MTLRVNDDVPAYIYRWIAGISGHMHVISGGVDMHLAFEDSRVHQVSTVHPDPDNGFQGYVCTREELPTREGHFGLYATSVMSPFDEFHVRTVEGVYVGRLNRGRDGLYAVFIKDQRVDPRNQRYKSIPEALKYVSGVLSGHEEDGEEEA